MSTADAGLVQLLDWDAVAVGYVLSMICIMHTYYDCRFGDGSVSQEQLTCCCYDGCSADRALPLLYMR